MTAEDEFEIKPDDVSSCKSNVCCTLSSELKVIGMMVMLEYVVFQHTWQGGIFSHEHLNPHKQAHMAMIMPHVFDEVARLQKRFRAVFTGKLSHFMGLFNMF